jgi:hypothetical protein
MRGLRARKRLSYDGPNLPAYSTLDDLFALIPGRRVGVRPTSAVVPIARPAGLALTNRPPGAAPRRGCGCGS